MKKHSPHSFHIPVMGLGFTIDTPIKVAKYGINSVVSIIEDHLIEKMREIICLNENIEYVKISSHEFDSRAKRITAYLNLMDFVIQKQIEKIASESFETDFDINHYFEMLPDSSSVKKLYLSLQKSQGEEKKKIEKS